jgi:farnesyl diphosphate synthase
MNIATKLEKCAEMINARLEELLPESDDGHIKILNDAMRYSLLSPGKRSRPFLTMYTGKLFGLKKEALLNVSCAIEMIHCYSLIHDDLPDMDNDDYRRGLPSCHKQFDVATALLAGDALLTKAFEVLSQSNENLDPHKQLAIISVISKACGDEGLIGGQVMDIQMQHESVSYQEMARMERLKTGAMFSVCCHVASIAAGASKIETDRILLYGNTIGFAFQIIDDIIDYKTDKNVSSNIVSKIGLDMAISEARMFISQAVDTIRYFGDDAEILMNFARHIEGRLDRK